MASQFIAEGLRQGEPGIIAVFEELPADVLNRASNIGIDFDTPQKDGTLKIIYIRPSISPSMRPYTKLSVR